MLKIKVQITKKTAIKILVVTFLLSLYPAFSLYYSSLYDSSDFSCVDSTYMQEKIIEKKIGNVLRPIGININANAVHTGYVEGGREHGGIREEASHVFLQIKVDMWGHEFSFLWESTSIWPKGRDYLDNWDYYKITIGDYLNGNYMGCDPYYQNDSRYPPCFI